jgi:hypothetical protein
MYSKLNVLRGIRHDTANKGKLHTSPKNEIPGDIVEGTRMCNATYLIHQAPGDHHSPATLGGSSAHGGFYATTLAPLSDLHLSSLHTFALM